MSDYPVFIYPTFIMPPPIPSAQTVIPRHLLMVRDSATTLFDVANRLTQALDSARFGDRSFYAPEYYSGVGEGFVLATQWEQIDEEGNPLPEPDRWAINVTPTRHWSLEEIFQALIGPNSGYFRVMVFFVTPSYVGRSDAIASRRQATDWTGGGAGFPPYEKELKLFSSPEKQYNCILYIYEFVQETPDELPVQRMEGGHSARTHLEKSHLWAALTLE